MRNINWKQNNECAMQNTDLSRRGVEVRRPRRVRMVEMRRSSQRPKPPEKVSRARRASIARTA